MVSAFAALAFVGGFSLTAQGQIGSGWSPGGETVKAQQTSAGCTIVPIQGGYQFHVPAGHGRAELRWSGADLSNTWQWTGTAKITEWPTGSSSTCIYQLWGSPSGDVIIDMDAGGGTTTNLISLHDTRKVVATVPIGVPFDFAAIYDPATATENIYINGSHTGTTILIDAPSGHYDKNGLYVSNSGSGPATIDWTNMSNWKGGTLPTGGGGPISPPTNLLSTGKTDTTVALSWTASTSASVTGYNIYNGTTKAGTTASNSFTVTGLTASTAYTFTVKATDGTTESAASNSVAVTTSTGGGGGPISPPTNLTVTNLTSTTATVSWTASTSPGVIVIGYNVSGGPGLVFPAIFPTTTKTSYSFSGLIPNTTYTINVSTVAELALPAPFALAALHVSQPASISFTTPPSTVVPPLPPTNLTVTNLTSTSATVSWTASTSPGVIGYSVSVGSGLVFPPIFPTITKTSYAFTGLTPNTTYTTKVITVAESVLPPPFATAALHFSQPASISFTTPPSIVVSPPVITSPGTASGTVGVPFSYQITATNSPNFYGATGLLQTGLSVDSSTGLISGTPNVAGIYTITLSASNAGMVMEPMSATNAAGVGTKTLTLTVVTPKAPNPWELVGAADFLKNGNSDLIWQNPVTGEHTIWLMNGTTYVSSVSLGMVPADWNLVGAADFLKNGNSDLIWQDAITGQCALWLMNGTTYVSSVNLGMVSNNWELVGAADFNGDGNPDLIWQNTRAAPLSPPTNQRALWIMNGTTAVSSVDLGIVPPDWNLVGAADFLQNGNSDLIWQNTVTGQCAIWLMNGTTYVSSVNLGMVSTDWRLVGAAAFGGAGNHQPDLIWRDTASGACALWLMNGTTYVSSVTFTLGLPQVAMPSITFNPPGGLNPRNVTISDATGGVSIRYTTDGSTPNSTAGNVYSGPVQLQPVGGTTTLKAIAYANGYIDSPVASATYTFVVVDPLPLSFNPLGGTYSSPQNVTITSPISGDAIRYTTDGSTPSETHGTLYSGPVNIGSTTTLQAIAYANGSADSPIAIDTYTIGGGPVPPATPVGLDASATSTSAISVTWNSSMGATSYDLQEPVFGIII